MCVLNHFGIDCNVYAYLLVFVTVSAYATIGALAIHRLVTRRSNRKS